MTEDMRILDAFLFDDGRTVLVVEGEPGSLIKSNTKASLVSEEGVIGELVVDSERMPGSVQRRRSFETRDRVDLDLLRSGQCRLRLHE